MGFPMFAKSFNPSGTVKKSLGEVNVPVICGGVEVRPGDIIAGDCDGVVVVPFEYEDEVFAKALEKFNKEQEIVEKLKGLGFTYVTLDLGGYRMGSANETL